MSFGDKIFITAGVVIIVFGLIWGTFLIGMKIGHDRGYRQGQVDCINKKIQYELKPNQDNESIWSEKVK